MGVCISVWRLRIGSFSVFSQKLSACACRVTHTLSTCHASLRVTCIIGLLLLIAGVESNPGPKYDDLTHQLNDILTELRDTRTALTTKIDDAINNLSAKLQTCQQNVNDLRLRLDLADRCCSNMQIDIDSLKTQFTKLAADVTGKSITPSIVPSPVPVSTNDVVKELYLRDLKKANIIITGLPITPLLNDDIAVKNLLRDELNINANITQCTRLGKPTAGRTQLLQVSLDSETTARNVIRSAKSLRDSPVKSISDMVYINPDLTKDQRAAQFQLRAELKRRRASGEVNLIIKNNRIVTKSSRTATAGALSSTAASSSSLGATAAAHPLTA